MPRSTSADHCGSHDPDHRPAAPATPRRQATRAGRRAARPDRRRTQTHDTNHPPDKTYPPINPHSTPNTKDPLTRFNSTLTLIPNLLSSLYISSTILRTGTVCVRPHVRCCHLGAVVDRAAARHSASLRALAAPLRRSSSVRPSALPRASPAFSSSVGLFVLVRSRSFTLVPLVARRSPLAACLRSSRYLVRPLSLSSFSSLFCLPLRSFSALVRDLSVFCRHLPAAATRPLDVSLRFSS